jgi:hypothetical protein
MSLQKHTLIQTLHDPSSLSTQNAPVCAEPTPSLPCFSWSLLHPPSRTFFLFHAEVEELH